MKSLFRLLLFVIVPASFYAGCKKIPIEPNMPVTKNLTGGPGLTSRTCPVPYVYVSTSAGTGTPGYSDGPVSWATTSNPNSVAISSSGVVYFSDWGNHCIRKIIRTGTAPFYIWQVATVAGNGTAGYVNGTGTAARFNHPAGIDFDNLGNLIVADCDNHAIRKITAAGVVTTVAGGIGAGFVDDVFITLAKFNHPWDVSVDLNNNDIFVLDRWNNRIRKVKQLSRVWTVAGGGATGTSVETGPALSVAIVNSFGIDYNSATGELVFTDTYRIKRLLNGQVSILAVGTGVFRGMFLSVRRDDRGFMYLSEDESGDGFGPYRIVQYNREINAFTSLAGSGSTSIHFADGPGPSASFSAAFGLAVSNDGSVIYIADGGNNRIRKAELSCL